MFAQAVVDTLAVFFFELFNAVIGGDDGYFTAVVAGIEYVDDWREFRTPALDRDRLGAEVVDAELVIGLQAAVIFHVVVVAGAREFTDFRGAEDFYSLSPSCVVDGEHLNGLQQLRLAGADATGKQ